MIRRSNGTTLQHAQNPALGAVAIPAVLYSDDHAVAVHRLIQVVAGDVHAGEAIVARRFGVDERKPAWIRRDAAHDEVHAIGQAESMTSNFDERTRRDERSNAPAERRPFFGRHAQQPQQFLGGRWMIHALANQP